MSEQENQVPAADEAAAPDLPAIFSEQGERLDADNSTGDPSPPDQTATDTQAETSAIDWQAEHTALKAQFEQAQKELHKQKSDEGRIAAYQRQINELREQLDGQAKQPEEKPAVLADYPEVQKLIQDSIAKALAERDAGYTEAEQERQKARDTLTAAVPDWEATYASKTFQDWYGEQLSSVKAWAQGSTDQIIDLFRLYEKSRPQKATRDDLAEAASTTNGTQYRPQVTGEDIDDSWAAAVKRIDKVFPRLKSLP
jgi:hypothetical protein